VLGEGKSSLLRGEKALYTPHLLREGVQSTRKRRRNALSPSQKKRLSKGRRQSGSRKEGRRQHYERNVLNGERKAVVAHREEKENRGEGRIVVLEICGKSESTLLQHAGGRGSQTGGQGNGVKKRERRTFRFR